ncbi:MAG: TonB-dependent receptor [Gammaproteobacteria bacterium]|nr:TonB-dependent receptor [Gammaproteobacteria bacterium]
METTCIRTRGRALAVPLLAAIAVTPMASESESRDGEDDADTGHSHGIEEVVVHGHPLGGEVSQSTAILDREELEHAARLTIGETLAQSAGVHSASFGPAVGQPVIHGMSGTRVLVLENHVSSMDASATGADHGVAVEPFLADRIEVIKGSGTLLYGSGAMGGTVDVHTHRIPPEIPDESLSGRLLIRGDTGSDTRYGGFRLDGGSGQWAWHLDGYSSENDDLEIPGYAAVDPHHDEDEHHEEEGHHDEDEHEDEHEHEHEDEPVEGILENSFGDYSGGAFGAAFHGERGHFGVAVAVRDWTYGIPGEHVHGEEEHHDEDDHHDEEEGEHHEEADDHHEEEGHGDEASPWIALEQTRFMADFGLENPMPGFVSLEGNVAISDYEHSELEEVGHVASHFGNDAWDARVVLETEQRGTWKAAVGVQFGLRDFLFRGEGQEMQTVETGHRAVFGVARSEFDGFTVETGARLEAVDHDPLRGMSEDYLASSLSVGVVVPSDNWELTARLDRSMRAPQAEELYFEGSHLAIGGFEMGDVDLEEEKSLNFTASAGYRAQGVWLQLEGYRYAFDNYIYQRLTSDHHDELPVVQWSQTEVTFLGVDAEGRLEVLRAADRTVDFIVRYDWVTTDIDDPGESHLPRVPPQRLALATEFAVDRFWGRIAYSRYFDQDEVASYETTTDGYGNLDIEAEYATSLGDADLVLFVAGRNLGDDEQREHASFVKDEAPLAGRRIEAGVRIRF